MGSHLLRPGFSSNENSGTYNSDTALNLREIIF
jgi:hypothetical protein